MIKIIKKLDQFGANFQPRINYDSSQYKTIQGAISSIILYGLCLAYLIYLLVEWQTNSILPKITTLSTIKLNEKIQYLDNFVSIQLKKSNYTYIDPFNPNAIIFQPIVYFFINGRLLENIELAQYDIKKNNQGFHTLEIKNLTTSISEFQTDEQPQIEMLIIIGTCLESYLRQGEKCAEKEVMSNFTNQLTNTFVIKQYIKEYNTFSKKLDSLNKEVEVLIENNKTFQTFSNIKLTNTQIDDGILFSNNQTIQYIVDQTFTGQQIGEEFFGRVLDQKPRVILQYKIDKMQQIKQITYVKLSEILADASSIASMVLILSYLFIQMNQSYLDDEAINDIISMFYPQFRNIIIKRNIFRKIIGVEFKGKCLNIKLFENFYGKLKKIGQIKLTIANQIYEISRIQFLLQKLFSRNQILKMHKNGIPINFSNLIENDLFNSKLNKINIFNDSEEIKKNNQNQIIPIERSQDFQYVTNLEENLKKQNSIKIDNLDSNDKELEIQQPEYQLSENDFDLLIQNSFIELEQEQDSNDLQKFGINQNSHILIDKKSKSNSIQKEDGD